MKDWQFSILTFWKFDYHVGFCILEIDNDPNGEYTRGLFGIAWNKEYRRIEIDFFWRIFTFFGNE